MTPDERARILEGAKEAFFAAMLDGYCGEKKNSRVTTSNNGNTKSVRFVHSLYIVEDEWDTNPESDLSGGTTRIFLSNGTTWHPVWRMSYGGRYSKEARAFLKRVLHHTYNRRKFVGGRGEIAMFDAENHLLYTNNLRKNAGFEDSSGTEYIHHIGGDERLGYHDFSCMALI